MEKPQQRRLCSPNEGGVGGMTLESQGTLFIFMKELDAQIAALKIDNNGVDHLVLPVSYKIADVLSDDEGNLSNTGTTHVLHRVTVKSSGGSKHPIPSFIAEDRTKNGEQEGFRRDGYEISLDPITINLYYNLSQYINGGHPVRSKGLVEQDRNTLLKRKKTRKVKGITAHEQKTLDLYQRMLNHTHYSGL